MTSQQILSIRQRAGLHQAQLAHMLGVSQPLIAAWEAGTRTPDEIRTAMLDRMTLHMDRTDDLNAYRRLLVNVAVGGVALALALLFKDESPPP